VMRPSALLATQTSASPSWNALNDRCSRPSLMLRYSQAAGSHPIGSGGRDRTGDLRIMMPRFYSIDQGVIPIKAVKPCSGDQRVSPDLSNPFLDSIASVLGNETNRIGWAVRTQIAVPAVSRWPRATSVQQLDSRHRAGALRPGATESKRETGCAGPGGGEGTAMALCPLWSRFLSSARAPVPIAGLVELAGTRARGFVLRSGGKMGESDLLLGPHGEGGTQSTGPQGP
jgi:hypothetical protein